MVMGQVEAKEEAFAIVEGERAAREEDNTKRERR
jgi:hypothetical protein